MFSVPEGDSGALSFGSGFGKPARFDPRLGTAPAYSAGPLAALRSEGRAGLCEVQGASDMTRWAIFGAVAAFLSACASGPTAYDLKPAYLAAVPDAVPRFLDCNGKSDLVCDCRRGGMVAEFPTPSRGAFDEGYAVYAAEREAGTDHLVAERRAVDAVLARVTAQVEDICTYHEDGAS